MNRKGGSISLRLALGFLLVLAVFGAALLATLYNLEKVKNASERIRERQEVRREAGRVRGTAEELFACQRAFAAAEGVDWEQLRKFQRLYERMEKDIRALRARRVQHPERQYLEQLGRAATRLRTIFMDKIVVAKVQDSMGMVPTAGPEQLHQESREALAEISDLNERLAYAFEARTQDAEVRAQGAWGVSVTISKAIFPMALLICLLIIYYTHRSIVRPVGDLVKGTKALGRGELQAEVDADGPMEFQELADSFNRMAAALDANQKRLVEAEKLAGVGRLAAGVAHEINNPIAVILGYTGMLLKNLPEDSPERERIRTIADEARQCKSIVDGLLDLSRPSAPTSGEVLDPAEVVSDVVNALRALGMADGIETEDSVISRPLPLTISRARLRQLTLNVVRNAVEVLQDQQDGRLQIEGYIRPREKLHSEMLNEAEPHSGSFLVLVFTDNGPGLPPRSRGRLFEPFFTTKPDGMGLGLAIVYNIVSAHDGFIEVRSTDGVGTSFTVGLPLVAEE